MGHYCLPCFITYTHFHSPSRSISYFQRYVNPCIFSRTSLKRQYSYLQSGQMMSLCILRRMLLSRRRQEFKQLTSMIVANAIIIIISKMIGVEPNPKVKLYTGREIPQIGYGTYQLRGEDCEKGVRWALQTGYTHIDTASIYRNEDVIGKVLKQVGVDRSKIFITSKIAPGEQGQARTAVEGMLSRLGIQYLDLVIIHWPGVGKQSVTSKKNAEIRRQTWRQLVQLQQQGKVRDIGVSNYLKRHLEDLLAHSKVKPSINQFEIHPLLWEDDTIEFCREHGIAIEAYSPLARSDDHLFKNQTVLGIAKKHKKTVAQVALRWSLQHGFIVLPKSKTKQRIIENFRITDFELSKEEMEQLNELRKLNIHTCWDPNSITY